MTHNIRAKMISICNEKIKQKGIDVNVSFYAFFENKNTNPELLMAVATWWIQENKFNHFEKAIKIKTILEAIR
jgi:hypothetical protein